MTNDMFEFVNMIDNPVPSGINSLSSVYGIILNLMFGVGIAITMIAVIASGIKYITSRGDFKAVAQAKNSLTYALLGLFLVIFSYTLKLLVLNSLGLDNPEIVNDVPGF